MPRILLVEDDLDSGDILIELFREEGIDVAWARSGEEALGLLPLGRYDVAFVDLSLPDMDGVEVARQIRSRSPATRLALVTGFSAPGVSERAPGLADRIFVKPTDPDVLIAYVRSWAAPGASAWQ
ncbi:MAG: response regulator transcription factor [Deltaproteobacteria bacterium]